MAEIYASTRSIGREQRGAAGIEVSRIEGEADSHTPSLTVFFLSRHLLLLIRQMKNEVQGEETGISQYLQPAPENIPRFEVLIFFGITALSNLSLPDDKDLEVHSVFGV